MAASNGIPVILDRINTAKAQVTERMNPILEKNARFPDTTFLVPEMGKSKEQEIKCGFVVIATLSIDPNGQSEGVSLALRNRFVTVAVEAPVLEESLTRSIAVSGMLQSTIALTARFGVWFFSLTPVVDCLECYLAETAMIMSQFAVWRMKLWRFRGQKHWLKEQ
jgi:midasin (ATPase involved in ribosome maturation)